MNPLMMGMVQSQMLANLHAYPIVCLPLKDYQRLEDDLANERNSSNEQRTETRRRHKIELVQETVEAIVGILKAYEISFQVTSYVADNQKPRMQIDINVEEGATDKIEVKYLENVGAVWSEFQFQANNQSRGALVRGKTREFMPAFVKFLRDSSYITKVTTLVKKPVRRSPKPKK